MHIMVNYEMMKHRKLPLPAKQSLWAFGLLLITVLVCRHLVSDQKQENRIEMLEVQMAQLEAQLAAHQTIANSQQASSTPQQRAVQTRQDPTKPSPRSSQPAKVARHDTIRPALDRLTEKLTEDNKSDKFIQPIRLELNVIDSLTLLRVPGIASRTASTILSYRNKLGGFYSPEQLRERLTWEAAQNYMDQWCSQWFKADESLVQMLHINSLSFKEINSHPYISYEQTKAIVRYRDRHGRIRSITELEQLEEFDDATLEKLKHYLSFE